MTAAVTIDHESTVPPYEQLRSQLAFQVRAGALRAGDRLPTVRQLARDLGLANNTVARAYRELEADELATGDGRRGTFVAAGSNRADDRSALIEEATQRYMAELSTLAPSLDELIHALRAASTRNAPGS